MPSMTLSDSSNTWPWAPQPMSAMLSLLSAEVFLAADFGSGEHEVSSNPALATAEAPMKSRRVMGCFTIF